MDANSRGEAVHKENQPTRIGALKFGAKATAHQVKRAISNVSSTRRHRRGTAMIGETILAQSRTPLFPKAEAVEAALVAGKIENLRRACARLNGVEVQANQEFSFWAQIGRPSSRRGFVKGRELREGCIIPTMGGGLCQLSNALYQCALDAGFQITERHAHSQIVPGSSAELGRDATVFWNYVDLRFQSRTGFRIETTLTADQLVVSFRGSKGAKAAALPIVMMPTSVTGSPASCESCGKISCFRNVQRERYRLAFGRTAYLVDECWAEYDLYISAHKNEGDVIGVPLDGRRMGRPNYAWNTTGFGKVHTVTLTTIQRSLAVRRAPDQVGARQKLLIEHDERLAQALAKVLTYDATNVVVSQNLLPFLWRAGHLGGRTFDVLMTRLPIGILEERLDLVSRLHPESPTAGQFRADDSMVEAEMEALSNARNLITPNSEVAAFFPGRAVKLPWLMPAGYRTLSYGDQGSLRDTRQRNKGAWGAGILFPASALARKGAYELREAAERLGLELVLTGASLEGAEFWKGVKIRVAGADPLERIGLVVLPAYIEDKPRLLLRALARGIPVIASQSCGLAGIPGVTNLPRIDRDALIEAFQCHVIGRAKYAAIKPLESTWRDWVAV